jgi:hypothetical protein
MYMVISLQFPYDVLIVKCVPATFSLLVADVTSEEYLDRNIMSRRKFFTISLLT